MRKAILITTLFISVLFLNSCGEKQIETPCDCAGFFLENWSSDRSETERDEFKEEHKEVLEKCEILMKDMVPTEETLLKEECPAMKELINKTKIMFEEMERDGLLEQ